MLKWKNPSLIALYLLSSVLLISCASAPRPLPTAVSKCPPFPEAPPSALIPPQATNATSDLQQAFQAWLGNANMTPPSLPNGKNGTIDSDHP